MDSLLGFSSIQSHRLAAWIFLSAEDTQRRKQYDPEHSGQPVFVLDKEMRSSFEGIFSMFSEEVEEVEVYEAFNDFILAKAMNMIHPSPLSGDQILWRRGENETASLEDIALCIIREDMQAYSNMSVDAYLLLVKYWWRYAELYASSEGLTFHENGELAPMIQELLDLDLIKGDKKYIIRNNKISLSPKGHMYRSLLEDAGQPIESPFKR